MSNVCRAMVRVRAGISEAMDEGHCSLPSDERIELGAMRRHRPIE